MEKDKTKLTWGSLRFEIKLFLIAIVAIVIGLPFMVWRAEVEKNARFKYVFPQGMKPIALMRDYDSVLDDVWLCETESGEYEDCTIWAIIDPRGDE